MASHLPAATEIREMLVGLLGRDIDVSPAAPLLPGPRLPASIALYVDDDMRVAAVVVCDLPMSAYAGAALGLVAPTAAEKSITRGILDETLRENLYEVLNIAASLFNTEGSRHLRLYDLHPAGDPIPAHLLGHALTLGLRQDLSVNIGGYGAGRVSVVLA